jgi:hypothetical protein
MNNKKTMEVAEWRDEPQSPIPVEHAPRRNLSEIFRQLVAVVGGGRKLHTSGGPKLHTR